MIHKTAIMLAFKSISVVISTLWSWLNKQCHSINELSDSLVTVKYVALLFDLSERPDTNSCKNIATFFMVVQY